MAIISNPSKLSFKNKDDAFYTALYNRDDLEPMNLDILTDLINYQKNLPSSLTNNDKLDSFINGCKNWSREYNMEDLVYLIQKLDLGVEFLKEVYDKYSAALDTKELKEKYLQIGRDLKDILANNCIAYSRSYSLSERFVFTFGEYLVEYDFNNNYMLWIVNGKVLDTISL